MAAKKKKKAAPKGPQEIPALMGMLTKPFRSPQGTATINRNAQRIHKKSRENQGMR
jgi:hypothetical protein